MNAHQIAADAPLIHRMTILENIGDEFQRIIQHTGSPFWAGDLAEDVHRATVLIELLEVQDCGSVGGFDKGQPYPGKNLFSRWDWLFRKYHNPEGRRFGCSIVSYEDIRKFFKKHTP